MKYLYVKCSDRDTGSTLIEYVCTCRYTRRRTEESTPTGVITLELVPDVDQGPARLHHRSDTYWVREERDTIEEDVVLHTRPLQQL